MKNLFIGTVAATKFFFIKNADKILMGLGIAANGAAVITAVKATSHISDDIEVNCKKIEKIKKELENQSDVANGVVDPEIKKKEIAKEYAKIALKVTKAYAPSAILFGAGTGCIIGGHNILKNRLSSTSALLAMTKQSFDSYRDRVKEAIGDDNEKKIFDGLVEKTIEVKEVDPKTGEVKTVKKVIETPADLDSYYNKYLWGREWCPHTWFKNYPNYETLIEYEAQLTQRLSREKYLFLEDALEFIGVDIDKLPDWKRKAIRNVGWVYCNDPKADNFVDFGIHEPGNVHKMTREATLFNDCIQDEIMLTFNCVGDIVNGELQFTDMVKKDRNIL